MAALGFGEVVEQLRRSTVQIYSGSERRDRSSGSGVIWSSDGAILTNSHVARASTATVELWDGRRFGAQLTARDPRRDLAVLRIGATGLPGALPADSARLRAGEIVLAVGNPLGFVGALTTGVVHAVGPLPGLGARDWVQANVRLAPGNSGGPLADAQGRIIGLNTMIAAGLALAIPSNAITAFLKRGGPRASLGVTIRPVPLPEKKGQVGLLLLEVNPGGAADRASLMIGDLLIGVDGKRFGSFDDLDRVLDRDDSLIHLQFLRGDRNHVREVAIPLAANARMETAA